MTGRTGAPIADQNRQAAAAGSERGLLKESANASETQPAKLVAVFVVDTHETKLVIPFGN